MDIPLSCRSPHAQPAAARDRAVRDRRHEHLRNAMAFAGLVLALLAGIALRAAVFLPNT